MVSNNVLLRKDLYGDNNKIQLIDSQEENKRKVFKNQCFSVYENTLALFPMF